MAQSSRSRSSSTAVPTRPGRPRWPARSRWPRRERSPPPQVDRPRERGRDARTSAACTGCALARAVEVDHVQRRGAVLGKARAWSTGSSLNTVDCVEVALAQAHRPAALQVDGGVERDQRGATTPARSRREPARQQAQAAPLDFSGWNWTPMTPSRPAAAQNATPWSARPSTRRRPRARSRRCGRSSRSIRPGVALGRQRGAGRPADRAPADVRQLEVGATAAHGPGSRPSPAAPGLSSLSRTAAAAQADAQHGHALLRGVADGPVQAAAPRMRRMASPNCPTPGSTTASAPSTRPGSPTTRTSAPSSSSAFGGAAQVAHLVVEHRQARPHSAPFVEGMPERGGSAPPRPPGRARAP